MIFPSSSCEKVFLSSLNKHKPRFSLIVKHSRSSNRRQHHTSCGCKLPSHSLPTPTFTERTIERKTTESTNRKNAEKKKRKPTKLIVILTKGPPILTPSANAGAPLCHSSTSILPLSMPPTPTSCRSSSASLLARSPALSTRLHVRRTCALRSARFEDLGFRVYCPLRT